MPGLTYSQYVEQVAQLAVVQVDNPEFVSIIPMMISYAELRMYRDLDLMQASEALTGPEYVLTPGNRNLTFSLVLPNGSSFLISEQINLILPAGTTDPNQGTRQPLLPTTKEFLDAVYGSALEANRAAPAYYAPFNENLFLVGPVPDTTYYVELVGCVRPAALSVSNTQTFLTQYFPDMFVMASMVFISAYQRNFGRQSDDPAMAQSYEAQYKTLLDSASKEEARKKYASEAWSSESRSVNATPTRGA